MTTQDDLNVEEEEQQEPVETDWEEEPVGDEIEEEQVGEEPVMQATPVAEGASKPVSTPAAKAVSQQEDMLDFERSTVTIVVQLYAQVGEPHPEGRRVSISVHNGAGRPVTNWYRASELSEKSELDKLQGGIARTVHRFRSVELSRRKLEAFEKEQQRKASRSSTRLSPTVNTAQTPVAPSATTPNAEETGVQNLKETETKGDTVPEQPVASLPAMQQGTQPASPATVQRAQGKGSKQKDLVQTSLF